MPKPRKKWKTCSLNNSNHNKKKKSCNSDADSQVHGSYRWCYPLHDVKNEFGMISEDITWLLDLLNEYFLGGKGGRCVRLTTYHHPVPLSRNLGNLNSWNPLGLSRPVMGLFYLLLDLLKINSLFQSLNWTCIHTHTNSLALSLSLSLSHTHTHTHTLSLSLFFSFSLSLAHKRACAEKGW